MPDAPAKVNPWLIAISVMFGTFMEVLDTTVVNVSLASHRGKSVGNDGRGDVGSYFLPRCERDHSSDHRLAGRTVRPQASADGVRHRIHGGIVHVRPCADICRS